MALDVGKYEGLFTRRSHISLRVNKASYLPTTRAINCLLYRNYTHNKTFFETNLTCYSICVVVKLIVAMGASGSGIHDIYFPGARGLWIHEVLSS